MAPGAAAPQELPGLAPDRRSCDELNAATQSRMLRAVRGGDWKLALDAQGAGQISDMATDSYALVNLYGQPAHIDAQAALLADLVMRMMRAQDPLPISPDGYRPKTDPRNWWTT